MLRFAALIPVLAVILAGCGSGSSKSGSSSGGGATKASASPSVQIVDYKFKPTPVKVKAGGKVTWSNEDAAPHSATIKGRADDADMKDKGQSASLTFDKPGRYKYFCAYHPFMQGVVEVSK